MAHLILFNEIMNDRPTIGDQKGLVHSLSQKNMPKLLIHKTKMDNIMIYRPPIKSQCFWFFGSYYLPPGFSPGGRL